MPCKPCTFEYSKGNGVGVAEALGNWGFSNEVASPGHELSRIQCLLERMDALREPTKCPAPSPAKKNPCCPASAPKRSPQRSCPKKLSPLIIHGSVADRIPTSDKRLARQDARQPLLGRSYFVQRNDNWYKLGPLCCPQPCCPAPYCPQPQQLYCYTGCCM